MNEFDKILKQKLQGYTETPPPEVFENISKKLPKRTVSDIMSAYKYYIVSAVAVVGIVTAIVYALMPAPEIQNPTLTAQVENITPDACVNAKDNTLLSNSDNANVAVLSQSPETKSSEPLSNSENKIDILDLKDTIICGNELLLENLDFSKVKTSNGLTISKTASGVKLNATTYGEHSIFIPGSNSVKITFVKPETIVASASKTELCYGEKLLITTSETSAKLSWNDDNYNVGSLGAGKYELSGLNTGANSIVIMTSGEKCASRVVFDVNVASKLNHTISTKPSYCSSKNGELVVKADSKINFCKINGSNISREGLFTGLSAGIYIVEINYANSCTAYDTVLVRDKSKLNAFFETSKSAFNENEYAFRNYTKLDDSDNVQSVDFEWFVNGTAISSDYNFDYEFKSNGKYVVELVARTGDCESRYSETIVVNITNFRIPNIFTPNGDGIGDEFIIKYNGALSNYDLSIYTKSGQLVYHSQEIDKSWDGKISGNNEASEGVYFYVVTATDESGESISQKGTVQLLR